MGTSRFDFFRILLPGATVVTLVYVVVTTVTLTPDREIPAAAEQLVQAIESPFRTAVFAFGVGLFLYFLDPAYRAPQYWKDVPSTHLQRRLQQRGYEGTDHISLNFIATDQLMPDQLQDRAGLYGALYRVGFQFVVYLLLTGALLPVMLWWVVDLRPALPDGRGFGVAGVILLVAGTPVVTSLLRSRRKPVAWRVDARVYAVTAWLTSLLFWGLLLGGGPPVVVLLPLLSTVAWTVLRHAGPAREWWTWFRDPSAAKPDVPHRPHEIWTLDLGMASVGLIGLAVLSGSLSWAQVLITGSLLLAALLLSFVRKHERQQNGIYRNQNLWIDANLDAILEIHQRAQEARE